MPKFHITLSKLCTGTVGGLLVVYIGIIAVVMTYASLTIEFSQSIKHDESNVAVLEAQYLATVGQITAIDASADGYAKPLATRYVPTKSVTALR